MPGRLRTFRLLAYYFSNHEYERKLLRSTRLFLLGPWAENYCVNNVDDAIISKDVLNNYFRIIIDVQAAIKVPSRRQLLIEEFFLQSLDLSFTHVFALLEQFTLGLLRAAKFEQVLQDLNASLVEIAPVD